MNTTATQDQLLGSLRSAGCVVDSCLRITALSGDERGVFGERSGVRKAAESGQPLVHVPASLIVTSAVAQRSDVARACLECVDGAGEVLQLALFVLTERAQGAASVWHWYIKSLPTSGSGALFLDDAALEGLNGTPLRLAADAKLRQLRAQYSAFSDVLNNWKRANSVPGPVDYESFKWATFVVLSRTISLHSFLKAGDNDDCLAAHLGSDRALVPTLDMLNHSAEPSAHWSVDADGAVSVFANEEHSASSTGQPVVELCFSYGDKPNTEWLYEYGFVPENNNHDAWPYFSQLSGSPSFVAIKRLWIAELGLNPRVMLSDPASSSSPYSIPRSALLSMCLAALDDTSDACSRQIGVVSLAHPYFTVNDLLVDDDDKLLRVPGLCEYARTLCSRHLVLQAEEMQANLASANRILESSDVKKYLASGSLLIGRIVSSLNT